MRLLIAQGPGYYGVNVRLLTDAEAGALEDVLDKVPDDAQSVIAGLHTTMMENGTSVILTSKIVVDKSTGFDTGWWDEGEKALDTIIAEAKANAAARFNQSKQGTE